MRSLVVAVALLASQFVPTRAARAQGDDRIGTRFTWGGVDVNIYPHPESGVHLAASTTSRTRGLARPHGFRAGFDPESVYTWLNAAPAVLAPTRPPSGPDAILVTPVLRSSDGDSLRLIRRAEGARWAGKVAVVMDERAGPGADHLDILAAPADVETFLRGMQREAGLSGFVPGRAAFDTAGVLTADTKIDEVPRVVKVGDIVHPQHGRSGYVITEFVIDTSGHPDLESFVVIFADPGSFAPSARQLISGTIFRPGQIDGKPVAVLVRQAINFAQ